MLSTERIIPTGFQEALGLRSVTICSTTSSTVNLTTEQSTTIRCTPNSPVKPEHHLQQGQGYRFPQHCHPSFLPSFLLSFLLLPPSNQFGGKPRPASWFLKKCSQVGHVDRCKRDRTMSFQKSKMEESLSLHLQYNANSISSLLNPSSKPPHPIRVKVLHRVPLF